MSKLEKIVIHTIAITVVVAFMVVSCAAPLPNGGSVANPTSVAGTQWVCGKNTPPERYIDLVAGVVCEVTCTGNISCIPGKDSSIQSMQR